MVPWSGSILGITVKDVPDGASYKKSTDVFLIMGLFVLNKKVTPLSFKVVRVNLFTLSMYSLCESGNTVEMAKVYVVLIIKSKMVTRLLFNSSMLPCFTPFT